MGFFRNIRSYSESRGRNAGHYFYSAKNGPKGGCGRYNRYHGKPRWVNNCDDVDYSSRDNSSCVESDYCVGPADQPQAQVNWTGVEISSDIGPAGIER